MSEFKDALKSVDAISYQSLLVLIYYLNLRLLKFNKKLCLISKNQYQI